MDELGVLAQVLPGADPAALARLVAAEGANGIAPDPLRRLAALLPQGEADAVAARFRLSNAQKKRLVVAILPRPGDQLDARVLAYRLGRESALDRLLLAGQSAAPLLGWDVPQFPLKGGDIVAAGVGAGPQVARILRRVEDRWLAEGFPDAARVRELLAEELAR